jgi:hypothetical protein
VIFRHGGACPRRAMFATRTPPDDVATPPRSSPPWSDVPGKTLWKHRSTRTSRMVARGQPMLDSGCEHSSTEASSVVGGASLSQRKSLSRTLTSYHSTQGRRRPASGQSALLSAIASGPVARVLAELGNLFRLALIRPSGSHRPPNDTEPGHGTTVAEPGVFQIRSGLESFFPDRLHLPALGEGVVKFLA